MSKGAPSPKQCALLRHKRKHLLVSCSDQMPRGGITIRAVKKQKGGITMRTVKKQKGPISNKIGYKEYV